MQFWDELEGKSLAGTYPLHRWLRTEGNAAWFATRYQEKPAIAYVVEMADDGDPVVASLETVSRVQHPNIVLIDRVGRASLEGTAVAYAIQEPTEDNLADALRERPLTTEEATQVTESLVGGLGALHAAGLLHGQVSATNVLAVGDTVKLRSDCVRKVAAVDKDKPSTYVQDVSEMGSLIFECLTQRRPAGPDDPSVARLPTPFPGIVKNTLAGRWGLEDVAIAFKRPAVETQRAAAVPPTPPKTKAEENAAEVPLVAKTVPPPTWKPVSAIPSVLADSLVEKESKGRGVRGIALIAILLVLGALWYFLHGSHDKTLVSTPETPTAAPAATGSGATGSGDATATSAAPAVAVPPTPAPTAAAPATPTPEAAAPATATPDAAASAGHKVWRVVVYTYGDQAKAQHKTDAILAKHPDLKPEVFTAAGHGPYLVTIGGPMDREDALKIRSHARKEGMAHDAYIQNYTH